MIKNILIYYAERLDEFLRERFPQPEGIVEIAFIGASSETKKNKLLISLVGIERESAIGISSTRNNRSSIGTEGVPLLNMNLNLILAAVYDEKRYIESLSVLSETLLFVQATPSFVHNRTSYTLEIVSPSSQELNNTWTSLGGQYYPSILCKLKGLVFDAREIRQTNKELANPIIDM